MHHNYSKEAFYYWLTLLGKNHSKFYNYLIDKLGSNEAVWEISSSGLNRNIFDKNSCSSYSAERFFDNSLKDKAYDVIEKVRKMNMNITTVADSNYPFALTEISSPPPVLFYYGRLPSDINPEMRLLSVVGSRTCTSYGRMCTKKLVSDLTRAGLGIVSGMARGIDTEAHSACLEAGGYTVAVLACGADVVYPPENRPLYEEIKRTGCVMSEMPPGTIPDKRLFPARNRIIAGLSEGTLVTEADKSSGAMITVDRAIDFNRTVYSVPGNIFSPSSNGTNYLIKNGAVCVTDSDDILNDLGIINKVQNIKSPGWFTGLSEEESTVVRSISDGNYTCDDISVATGLESASVSGLLIMLEIRGIIKCLPGGFYKII